MPLPTAHAAMSSQAWCGRRSLGRRGCALGDRGARGPLVVGEIWDDGLTVGEVTLGGRRLLVERPRVRTADRGAEVPLCTYTHFASRDPLTALVFGAHWGVKCAATAANRSRSASAAASFPADRPATMPTRTHGVVSRRTKRRKSEAGRPRHGWE